MRERKGKIVLHQVPLVPQAHKLWCWAACGEMIARFWNLRIDQDDLVAMAIGKYENQKPLENRNGLIQFYDETFCKPNIDGITPALCDTTGFPTVLKKFGFNMEVRKEPLEWEEIRKELLEKPLILGWEAHQKKHVVIVEGFNEMEEKKEIFIVDPWPKLTGKQYKIDYQFFLDSLLTQKHWRTYWKIQFQNAA